MHIAILGRQPQLGMAELERLYGSDNTRWFSSSTATVKTATLDVTHLGGVVKVGQVSATLKTSSWREVSREIERAYSHAWSSHEGKITLGLSAYGFDVSAREVQKIGITIKKNLKKGGVSLRLIPNAEVALNTATSHHNKLGLSPNKVELLIVRGKSGQTIIAESAGSQNITALAARDQARPKRDAFVGMLPPKLALLMLNLATAQQLPESRRRVLDPFCGTGVVLQEAALRGFAVYGTDLSEKMVRYTKDNLSWLQDSHSISFDTLIHEGDAMTSTWQQPIDLVVSEAYLGQPFSAPPSPSKLEEVKGNVNHILVSFLKNLHPQLKPGTQLCLAVPAWRGGDGRTTRLPLLGNLENLGYRQAKLINVQPSDLLYYREDQVVARQLLVLTRA